eukprot:11172334-Lingulodinium_polyedra.AAC.1
MVHLAMYLNVVLSVYQLFDVVDVRKPYQRGKEPDVRVAARRSGVPNAWGMASTGARARDCCQ